MIKHVLTNGSYFQTLTVVCITYCYTHTQINDFVSMRRNRLDHVAGGIFWGKSKTIFGTMASGSSNSDGQRDNNSSENTIKCRTAILSSTT